jgi:acetylornithine deacetylase/succinyl-diaminopimelate desuccinylase-like protein
MDVVPADLQDWKVPPFSGQIKDGEIWGRGALDDKGPGVVQLMAMLAIKRSGVLLDRDILFLATGDEEDGGKLGAGWVVDNQPDLYGDAVFVLNEGGGIRGEKDKDKLYAVSVTEKSPLWLRLTATGPSGHSATPPEDTAVTRLVRALGRIDDYRPPVKVVAPVEAYYRIRAELDHDSSHVRDLRKALKDPAFSKQFLSVKQQSALVHDTITPTVLSASQKTNVLPSAAYAELDCRLLPGEDPKNFEKVLKEVIGDDKVRIDEILNFPSLSSPEKSELMSAIETLAKRKDNGAPVIPTMLSGFTDSHYFREKGLIAYGFTPLESSPDEADTVHAENERISIANLRGGLERMVELLQVMGGR